MSARENSVKQLSDLYNVVVGVALSLAIFNTIEKASPYVLSGPKVLNLLAFLVLVIPFYHGAVRHLFATYVEDGGSKNIKSGALLADFVLLFIEGCFFVVIASLFDDVVRMAYAVIALLVLDCVWGFLAWLAFTGAGSQFAEKRWALINMVASLVLFVVMRIFASDSLAKDQTGLQIAILGILLVRTIFDYKMTWSFYFPEKDFHV